MNVVAAVGRRRAQHDPRRPRRPASPRGPGHDLGHREGQLAQPLAGRGGDREDPQAALLAGRRRTMSAMSRPSGTSILLRATSRGRSSRPPYARQLVLDDVEVARPGCGPGSMVAVSRTCTSAAQRSMWRRKSWPRPRPSLAPSIRPGTSATVNVVSPARDHAEVGDQRGERVVGDLGPRPARSRRSGWTCRRWGSRPGRCRRRP